MDWTRIAAELDARGWALTGPLLKPETCAGVADLYPRDEGFRSRVVMARHGFGRGEYKYFSYPLPDVVQRLREGLYGPLSGIANRWAQRLGEDRRFPQTLAGMLERCHDAGQVRPTPLLLTYGPGDYNCLHQDRSLWRARLPAAGGVPSGRARPRFYGRRVRHRRAASAPAIGSASRAAAPGRRRDLRGTGAPGRRDARGASAGAAAWGERSAQRKAADAGGDLS